MATTRKESRLLANSSKPVKDKHNNLTRRLRERSSRSIWLRRRDWMKRGRSMVD